MRRHHAMTHADNERNYKVTEAMRADAVYVIKNYKVKKHLVLTHAENVSKHKFQSDETPRRCESMRFL